MEDVEQMTKVMYPDAVRFWIENRGIPAQLVQGRPPDLIVEGKTYPSSLSDYYVRWNSVDSVAI